jgi:hypothetical protein
VNGVAAVADEIALMVPALIRFGGVSSSGT